MAVPRLVVSDVLKLIVSNSCSQVLVVSDWLCLGCLYLIDVLRSVVPDVCGWLYRYLIDELRLAVPNCCVQVGCI